MPIKNDIASAVEHISNTYKRWSRETTINTMRHDWDALYPEIRPEVTVTDTHLNSTALRWITPRNDDNNKVVLYLHGGGFRLGSNRSHARIMSDIAVASNCTVVGVEYRLLPEHPYPCALDDCYEVYYHLTQTARPGYQIILAGDSAGGGLAAALWQKIRNNANIPWPVGMVLLSPWVDLTLSGDSYESKQNEDPIHQTKMLALIAKEYLGSNNNIKEPTASPLFGEFTQHPKTLIQVGTSEIGLDDAVQYAENINCGGGLATLSIWPAMIHVFQMYPDYINDAKRAIAEIGEFIKAL